MANDSSTYVTCSFGLFVVVSKLNGLFEDSIIPSCLKGVPEFGSGLGENDIEHKHFTNGMWSVFSVIIEVERGYYTMYDN